MPQMCPLMWVGLMFVFILFYFIYVSVLYFEYCPLVGSTEAFCWIEFKFIF